MNNHHQEGTLAMRVLLFSVFLFFGLSLYFMFFTEERATVAALVGFSAGMSSLFTYIRVMLRDRNLRRGPH